MNSNSSLKPRNKPRGVPLLQSSISLAEVRNRAKELGKSRENRLSRLVSDNADPIAEEIKSRCSKSIDDAAPVAQASPVAPIAPVATVISPKQDDSQKLEQSFSFTSVDVKPKESLANRPTINPAVVASVQPKPNGVPNGNAPVPKRGVSVPVKKKPPAVQPKPTKAPDLNQPGAVNAYVDKLFTPVYLDEIDDLRSSNAVSNKLKSGAKAGVPYPTRANGNGVLNKPYMNGRAHIEVPQEAEQQSHLIQQLLQQQASMQETLQKMLEENKRAWEFAAQQQKVSAPQQQTVKHQPSTEMPEKDYNDNAKEERMNPAGGIQRNTVHRDTIQRDTGQYSNGYGKQNDTDHEIDSDVETMQKHMHSYDSKSVRKLPGGIRSTIKQFETQKTSMPEDTAPSHPPPPPPPLPRQKHDSHREFFESQHTKLSPRTSLDQDHHTNVSNMRGSRWGKLSTGSMHLFEYQTSKLYPKIDGYFLTYGNVRWHVLLRKEIFLPDDSSDQNAVLQELIYQQILQDAYCRTCCRLSQNDRTQLRRILEATQSTSDDVTAEASKNLMISQAKKFDFYFSRIFPIMGYREHERTHTYLAIAHTGIRFAVRDGLHEELRCDAHFTFSEIVQVKSFKEKLTLDTITQKFILHSSRAFMVKKLIDTFLRKHKKAELYVHALCDFKPAESEFLSFSRGDIIRLLEKSDLEDGWLFGFVHDKKGKFPANYVEDYQPTSMLQSRPDDRMLVRQIQSPLQDDVSISSSETETDDGKFSMMEFAFRYFRQEEAKSSSQRKRGIEKWTWKNMTDLIKYSEEPLQNSLLNYNNKHLSKMAVEISKAIWTFMGDYTKSKHQNETDLLLYILQAGRDVLDLRDEIFCQLAKQTTNNKSYNRDSLSRGWRLIMICTAYFDCSQWLKPYLFKYLRIANNPKREIHGAAAVSEQNLIRSFKYGGRKHYPQPSELEKLLQGRFVKQQVVMLPGKLKCMVRINTSSTGADAVTEVCREMGLENEDDVSEFGIFTYLEDQNLLLSLQKNDYIFDVFAELEKQDIHFSLAFRKVIWYQPVKFNDTLLVEVLYNQVLPDVMNGHLLHVRNQYDKMKVSTESIALLAALQYRAAGGKGIPALREISNLMPVLVLNSLTPNQWTVKVQDSLDTIHHFTTHAARRKFLEIVSTWPYFGSSFFFIKHVSHSSIQGESVVAINKGGVSFLSTNSNETLVSFAYNDILSTRNLRTEAGRLFLDLKCGDLMIQKVTRLETPRGKEISNLIGQYISKITAEEQHHEMVSGVIKSHHITPASTKL